MNFVNGAVVFSEGDIRTANFRIPDSVPLSELPDVEAALVGVYQDTARWGQEYGSADLAGRCQRKLDEIYGLLQRIIPLTLTFDLAAYTAEPLEVPMTPEFEQSLTEFRRSL